jgi:hypothetical protein
VKLIRHVRYIVRTRIEASAPTCASRRERVDSGPGRPSSFVQAAIRGPRVAGGSCSCTQDYRPAEALTSAAAEHNPERPLAR